MLLLDLTGVLAAGWRTELSRIARDIAVEQFGGAGAVPLDGRPASPSGAAMAVAFTIDALDAHDGYKPAKGHAGCASLAAALATSPPGESGPGFMARLVLGYEIGCRAGTALHATASDYHTSGAWMAIACAAIASRALGLDADRTREAMGIAEYHGPRSPMMRCIDHPTMVKDGSGWGALSGVSAAALAARGFTGAPAELLGVAAGHWHDLGTRWLVAEQYVKPEPVCRWAQPAVHAALALRAEHGVEPAAIEAIEVASFAEAVRLVARHPRTTEEAQYSLPYPVAAALARGTVGPDEIAGDALRDPIIGALADRVTMRERPGLSALFPARRVAEVTLRLRDGRTFASGPTEARGDPEAPLGADAIRGKFRRYAEPVLGRERTDAVGRCVEGLWDGEAGELVRLLRDPPRP